MNTDGLAPALPHGELREVLPDVFMVTGTVEFRRPVPLRFSRNMTVLRHDGRLVLVNSVRLSDEGLRALDALGKVTDVIRLAGFHGMDDPFYKRRDGARVWAVRGQRYTRGLNAGVTETYFQPDVEMDTTTELPIAGAKLFVYRSAPPEGLLVLDRDGGIAISGDSLQNWQKPDAFFSTVGGVLMRIMGFIKPHNVGPGWLKQAKPPVEDLRAVKAMRFEHLLPSHGAAVHGGASQHYGPSLERAAGAR
jgi:hypothetical protein